MLKSSAAANFRRSHDQFSKTVGTEANGNVPISTWAAVLSDWTEAWLAKVVATAKSDLSVEHDSRLTEICLTGDENMIFKEVKYTWGTCRKHIVDHDFQTLRQHTAHIPL